MRHITNFIDGQLAVCDDFVAESAFGANGDMILRGLAIDEETRAARTCSGGFRSRAVALFADDE